MAGKIKHLQITALLCVIAVALALFIGFAANNVYADTQTPVKYVDENGTEHQIGDYTVLTGSDRGFSTDPCEKTYTIVPEDTKPFTANMVSLSAGSFVYNGRVQKPAVQVKYEGKAVAADKYT